MTNRVAHNSSDPGESRGCRQGLRLRIIATTDIHVRLHGYDYYADRAIGPGGLARIAPLIRRLRDDAPAALLVDNGDFLQGSPLADTARTGTGADAPHPAVAAMNRLGYDAGTLGNHDFDYGLPTLEAAIAQACFPLVSANIHRGDGGPLVPPWTIVERQLEGAGEGALRIGLIGLAPPQLVDWNAQVLDGQITAEDILDAARAELPRLRAAGADIVVALCHSGIGAAEAHPGMENAAVPLAALDGIDVVVTGHTHMLFPSPRFPAGPGIDPASGTLHGTPAVMAGSHGSHVGVIDLDLARDAEGWRILDHRVDVHAPDADETEDPSLLAEIAAPHAATRAALDETLGRTLRPIHTFFSMVAPCPASTLVARAQREHVRAVRPDLADLPLLSAAAPLRSGGWGGPHNYVDIPPGRLARRNAAELHPYLNAPGVVELTGAQLADWLERAASLFATLVPGRADQALLAPGAACYNFDLVDGVTWEIDPTRPPRFAPDGTLLDADATRIRDLRMDGRPLSPESRVLLVTNAYRIGGGGGFRAARAGRLVHQDDTPAPEVVARRIRAAGTLDLAPPQSWRFAPMPTGTGAWVDTGPGALAHPRPAGLVHAGPGEDGFERFTLTL